MLAVVYSLASVLTTAPFEIKFSLDRRNLVKKLSVCFYKLKSY